MPDPNPQALTPPQPFMGAIPPANQNTYPVQSVAPQQGSSGGLVNVAAQIQGAGQAAQNQANQAQQMDRAAIEFREKQAASKSKGDIGTPDSASDATTQQTAQQHSGFMAGVLQGLHSMGAGVQHLFGAGPPQGAIPQPPQQMQGPPAPPPQQGPPPPGMQNGGPVMGYAKGGVVDNGSGTPIHKTTLVEKLQQGVSDLADAAFGSGAGNRAATAARASVNDASSAADKQVTGYAGGGPVQPQPQPTILAFHNGGGVPGDPNGIPLPFVSPLPPGAIPGLANGGAVPNSHGGGYGVTDMGVRGIRGFADGGSTDVLAAPSAVPSAAVASAPPPPDQARAELQKTVHELGQTFTSHTLNDDGVPNAIAQVPVTKAEGAIPGQDPQKQATAQTVQNVSQSAPAAAGDTGPSSSERPHSITPEQWQDYEARKEHAVKMAAYAGEDPGQVRAALNANQNAWIQGGVLRYLSAANTALLNGDTAGVEKAMKNAYYYMPDGQELQTKKIGGQLMYQDPISPTTKDGKPNMIPVDAAHIQMLGTAMLDPSKVQETIMNVRSAQAKIALEQSQARGAENTGLGNLYKGMGIAATGQSHLKEVDSINFRNLAEGDAARIKANAFAYHMTNLIKTEHMDPALLKGSVDAANSAEKSIQGALGTVPTMIDNPKKGQQGQPDQIPNDTNSLAGHSFRDPSKSALPDATASEINNVKGLAGKIFLGSHGTVPPDEAARLAILGISGQRKGAVHPGPDGKPQQNFYTDPKTGDTHVWNPAKKGWEAFKLPLTSSAEAVTGNLGVQQGDVDQAALAYMSEGGGGKTGSAIPNAADTPDMEPQQFPAES